MGAVAGSSAQRVQQVRSGLGERPWLRRKRFSERELEVERFESSVVVELPKQTITLREKLLAVSSRMDERGAIRKHRERGGLGPRKLIGSSAEVTPRSRLEPDDVPAERRVACVKREDFVFRELELEPEREHGFDDFFTITPLAVAAGESDNSTR